MSAAGELSSIPPPPSHARESSQTFAVGVFACLISHLRHCLVKTFAPDFPAIENPRCAFRNSHMASVKAEVTIRNRYFETPGGQVHCQISQPSEQARQNGPPILLLHMSASSSKCWLSLMQELSSLGFSCFAPDMPGFGESFDPAHDPPGIHWYSRLYHSILSSIPNFTDGCHVIGHHSGAIIGTDLAARCPGFVHSLTLVGPAIMSAEERRAMAETTMVPFNKPVKDGSHLTKTWNYLIEKGISKCNVELLQREALDHIRAWKGRLQIYVCVWDYDCVAAMKNIDERCKTLALCARGDVLWPYFENVRSTKADVITKEIVGANFGPDLGMKDILKEFLALIEDCKVV